MCFCFFFFQAEDGIRDAQESRGLGDVYKRQEYLFIKHNISIDVSDKLKQIILNTKNMKEKYDQLLDLSLSLPANLDNYYEEFKYRQFPFLLYEEDVLSKTKDVIDKVIFKDIPQYDNIYSSNLLKIENILRFLAVNEKTNYDNITKNVGLKRDLVEKIFGLLVLVEKICLVILLEN